jgi:hypothetical protein
MSDLLSSRVMSHKSYALRFRFVFGGHEKSGQVVENYYQELLSRITVKNYYQELLFAAYRGESPIFQEKFP